LATNNSGCPNQRIQARLQDIQQKLTRTPCFPKAQNKEKKTHVFAIFCFLIPSWPTWNDGFVAFELHQRSWKKAQNEKQKKYKPKPKRNEN
jgi:hypothetical protein